MPSTAGRRYVTTSVEAWRHRVKLFYALEELEAQDETFRPLHDLRDNALPLVKSLSYPLASLICQDYAYSGHRYDSHPVTQAMYQWEKKWNFPDWARVQVVSTVSHWVSSSAMAYKEPVRWDGMVIPWMNQLDTLVNVLPDLGAQQFERLDKAIRPRECEVTLFWNPLLESWKHAESRMLLEFKETLEAYRHQIESECQALGLEPESQKYQKSEEQHYRWFIRHVFQGWTYERIADEEGVPDSSTVRKAVKDLGRRMKTPVERNTYFDAVPSVT